MSKNKTGGPAFPRVASDIWPKDSELGMPQSGMTLRDKFAESAMPILMRKVSMGHIMNAEQRFVVAKNAYLMADSMLEARDR